MSLRRHSRQYHDAHVCIALLENKPHVCSTSERRLLYQQHHMHVSWYCWGREERLNKIISVSFAHKNILVAS